METDTSKTEQVKAIDAIECSACGRNVWDPTDGVTDEGIPIEGGIIPWDWILKAREALEQIEMLRIKKECGLE